MIIKMMNKIIDAQQYTGVLVIVIFSVLAVLVSGCTEAVKEEKPLMINQTLVPPAPKQLFIKAGQFEQFTYWGHNIAVNYTSIYPTQIVKITLDGIERTIQKNLTESPAGVYWKEGDLSFTLKPVVWEIRDGQKIPIYESTWNTTEVYFDVMVKRPSEAKGVYQH